ncbi:hypothetical protein Ari01nite_55560 [Paractinoplanes rishiriensis]|uniref:Uncharacterized protein n=1 Tax=Paractinoplanes rishiriensis TaxID=1050105 RepID=A0A919MSE1_9ACTN|nr:hypothetical protein Ari01nite_55560 [Actinoplanes rishiriensis]
MKLWSDVSTIFRLVLVCLLLGFLAGLCAAGGVLAPQPRGPAPTLSPGRNTVPPVATINK